MKLVFSFIKLQDEIIYFRWHDIFENNGTKSSVRKVNSLFLLTTSLLGLPSQLDSASISLRLRSSQKQLFETEHVRFNIDRFCIFVSNSLSREQRRIILSSVRMLTCSFEQVSGRNSLNVPITKRTMQVVSWGMHFCIDLSSSDKRGGYGHTQWKI
jgi:hypothetical protein